MEGPQPPRGTRLRINQQESHRGYHHQGTTNLAVDLGPPALFAQLVDGERGQKPEGLVGPLVEHQNS